MLPVFLNDSSDLIFKLDLTYYSNSSGVNVSSLLIRPYIYYASAVPPLFVELPLVLPKASVI